MTILSFVRHMKVKIYCLNCDIAVGPNNDVTLETLIRENSWFFCEYCSYKTKKEKGLTIHIYKMHGAEKVESFKCDICEN